MTTQDVWAYFAAHQGEWEKLLQDIDIYAHSMPLAFNSQNKLLGEYAWF